MENGARIVLLDNLSPEEIFRAVEKAKGRILLEVSGGIRPDSLADVAGSGADRISIGTLTHSAPAANLALDLET